MASVLFVIPIGQDMGGIITSTEQYILGLREAGHDVTPICAVFTQADLHEGGEPRGKFADDYVVAPGTGWLLHPTQGWRSEDRFSMVSPEGRARFADIASAHDWVVWASMYGFRNKATEGTTDWVKCIKAAKGKNIFMIHDDHLPLRYKWAGALAPYAALYVGVQPCSYASLKAVKGPRSMVYTPLPAIPHRVASIDDRSGFLSCQIWKPWKHGDKMVAAAAHMPKGTVKFAGDGIQLRYIRSKEKCPERFVGIWDAAMKKQKYLGVLSEEQRDRELSRTKFLVDLSYRQNEGQYNRIVQEAMAQGCVVIANPRFISGNSRKPLFEPGVHYIPVSTELYDDPKVLATALKNIDKSIDPKLYSRIQKAARELVATQFNREYLGGRLIEDARLSIPCRIAHKEHVEEFKTVFGAIR